MRIRDGYLLREMGDDHLIVGPGESMDGGVRRIVRINASAAFLWHSVEGRDFDVSDLASLLEREYALDRTIARTDAEGIAKAWLLAGIVLP